MTKNKLPPISFSNVMHKIDRPVDAESWRDVPEWEVFKAGYNTAVQAANERILAMYEIPKVAERVFCSDGEVQSVVERRYGGDVHPDLQLKVWIDSCGIEWELADKHSSAHPCLSFTETYDEPGQVAALWSEIHTTISRAVEDFRKSH